MPLVHPVFAAKSIVTADHVGQGRFGINIVSGWNVEEFAMFGIPLREHDERYDYSAEWVSILKRIYSETGPFDYDGKYFSLKNVNGKPKPWGAGVADADERGLVAGRAASSRSTTSIACSW